MLPAYDLGEIWRMGGVVIRWLVFLRIHSRLCVTGLSRACSVCRPDRLVCVKSVWNCWNSVADLK
jgi:hypothetical protein